MSPNTLYRLAGISGVLAGVLLLFNDARRVGAVPENDLTHSVAPVPALLALFALTGLYLRQRETAGRLGLWGYALNLAGLAGALVVEFVAHYVFRFLDQETVDRLLAGRTGTGFLVISVGYLAGIVLFGLATARSGVFPAWQAALYVIGFVPTALRAVLPEAVVSAGFVLGSVAVILLSWRLATENAVRPGVTAGT